MEFLLLPLLWVAVTFALSHGGWQQLAAYYRAPLLPSGASVSLLGQASLGWVSYKNVLRAGACREGLILKVFFLFRPFHPPLLIPWRAVSNIRATTRLWSTTYSVVLTTSETTSEELKFKSTTFLAVLQPWVGMPPAK